MIMVMEVEFDLNPTDLYNHICNSDWESALHCVDVQRITRVQLMSIQLYYSIMYSTASYWYYCSYVRLKVQYNG